MILTEATPGGWEPWGHALPDQLGYRRSAGGSRQAPELINGERHDRRVTRTEQALVLKAFDTLFNKRDYVAAERFWSDRYIQHSAHIAPGREGLFALFARPPGTLRYESLDCGRR